MLVVDVPGLRRDGTVSVGQKRKRVQETHFPPLHAGVRPDGAFHSKRHALEPKERPNNSSSECTEHAPFDLFRQSTGLEDEVIEQVGEHEDRKVEGRELEGRKGE